MDFLLALDIFFQLGAFMFLIYFVFYKDKDTNKRVDSIINDSYQNIIRNTNVSLEKLTELEEKHWIQLEKQQARYLQVIEKQHNKLSETLETVVESRKTIVEPTPHLLDNLEKIENTIEKEELEEQNLEDIGRIPIVDGMNVQFDGSEEVLPINIS